MTYIQKNHLVLAVTDLLEDCSEVCKDLQSALSPLILASEGPNEFDLSTIQQLDKLTQQILDIKALLTACSQSFDDLPCLYERSLSSSVKLNETRSRVMHGRKLRNLVSVESGLVDLF